MNIVYLEHYAGSDRHGMEYRPFYLARRWAQAGDTVTIVASSFSHLRGVNPDLGDKPWAEENIDGVRYFWIRGPRYEGNGLGRIRNMLSFLRGVSRYRAEILKTGKPDVVIASSTYPLDIYPARRIAGKYGAQLIYEVHDLWPLSPMTIGGMSKHHPFIVVMQRAENACYRSSDYVVSLLPCAKEHMTEHGMDPGKFVCIPNGILAQEWEAAPDPAAAPYREKLARYHEEGWFLIGYAGGHALSNALDTCIEAGQEWRGKKLKLILVGQGVEKERLMKKAEELGVTENVEFLPPVKKADIPALLAQFDALYVGLQRSPLYRYGISLNKLMDYMMAGKPILFAGEVGNDMVAEAGCGLSIPPEDSHAVAEAALRLAGLPFSEREAMGRRGQEYILANNEYSGLADRFREVFERGKFPKE